MHAYLACPAGEHLHNVEIAPGVELKVRGYAVLPTSIHPSGGTYEWKVSSAPADVPLAELPAWLIERARAPAECESRNAPGWVAEALRGVAKGQRAKTCAKLAGHYLRLGVPSGDVAVLLKSGFVPACNALLGPDDTDRFGPADVAAVRPGPSMLADLL